jgi:NAD-dependent DNA ligase
VTLVGDGSQASHFARQAARYANESKNSLRTLVGIAIGILADKRLNDDEIRFLSTWLQTNDAAAYEWPGDVLHARIKAALADGRITEAERSHLVQTLQALIGGDMDALAASTHVTDLAFDAVQSVQHQGFGFCLTGGFVYGPRETCVSAIESRGGVVRSAVSRNVHYLVVGGLGSEEWKHGSFGTKIAQAMKYKQEGVPILVVHEDKWAASL